MRTLPAVLIAVVLSNSCAAPPLLHQGAVNAVAFSPDGKIVLTGSRDGKALLWDAATGKQLIPSPAA
jgi:WD40 repeat protein